MNKRALILVALTLVQLTVPVRAATPQEARAALAKATAFMRSISAGGGWLWTYSTDLKERAGERPATPTQIWIQPPGTPSMGMALLRAYEATGDKQYLDAAKAAADALATGQLESGGWDYVIDFDANAAKKWYRRSDAGKLTPAEISKRVNISTFDDNTTQSAVRFLLAVVDASKGSNDARDQRIRAALEYALKKMLEAQFPNGGWPQRYDGKPRNAADFPVKQASIPKNWPREHAGVKYFNYYTLNDNGQRDCMATMIDAWKRTGKAEYLAAAKRGGDFLLLAQLPAPQAGWAQQYNQNMEPAWARAFEPPAVTGGESSGAIRTLVELYLETGEEKYIKTIPAAIDWYQRSAIAPNRWARYYELGSNKPIYGDRDGKIHYTLEELSEERRTHYGWQGDFNVQRTITFYEQVKAAGREAWLEKQKTKPLTDKQKESRAKSLAPRADKAIAAMDAQGRWLARGKIDTRLFIDNLGALCDYLEVAGK
ncbi:MAG: pectate lyase [Verrucomicrobiota bacterium]